jgi:hypothetical protein
MQADPPSLCRGEWTSVKHTLGLAHPNLPYFKHADLSLTQSAAILHYVARTWAPATSRLRFTHAFIEIWRWLC